jgi:hypothetical protein
MVKPKHAIGSKTTKYQGKFDKASFYIMLLLESNFKLLYKASSASEKAFANSVAASPADFVSDDFLVDCNTKLMYFKPFKSL